MRESRATFLILFLAFAVLAVSSGQSAWAQTTTRTKPQGPFYNPRNDTYYELRADNFRYTRSNNAYGDFNWASANRRAQTKVYKGRRGRLAVVRDKQVFDFIRSKFRIDEESFIGVRFFCGFRKLVWVTGEVESLGKNRSFWFHPWRRSNLSCTNNNFKYMSVYLTPNSQGVLWRASGPEKGFFGYFVEYPPVEKKKKESGAPASDKSAAAADRPKGAASN